ncbi:hypothetical protein ACFY64_14760 [Streptomyces collinus]|uniref:hypothetical protein n=1 Tax=Streptomyces collinus TaxID=42684 RepID=UPI0036A7C7CF
MHERVRDLLADGAIGEVLSVHFEWLLDVRHGADYAGGARLTLRPLWQPPQDVPLTVAHAAHGGGDPRMLDALFGPVGPTAPADTGAAVRPTATERDGALALAVGLAANRSFETGRPVRTDELIAG